MESIIPTNRPTTRRDALKIGGLTMSLGALVAACGENVGGSKDAGRVGNAPVVTELPTYEIDDVVLLRTAASIEYTAVEAYQRALALQGAVPEAMVATFERIIADHDETALEMIELTTAAGGDPWACPNPWFTERLLDPMFDAISSNVVGVVLGDEGAGRLKVMSEEVDVAGDTVTVSRGALTLVSVVETTDGKITSIGGSPASPDDEVELTRIDGDVESDVVTFMTAIENLAAAAHQELVTAAGSVDARIAHARAAALSARHAAVLAIAANGPSAYASPALLNEEVISDERGQFQQYAVPSTFAQTAQIEIKAGPADQNNVRTSYLLQTPAANSFVYNELVCES